MLLRALLRATYTFCMPCLERVPEHVLADSILYVPCERSRSRTICSAWRCHSIPTCCGCEEHTPRAPLSRCLPAILHTNRRPGPDPQRQRVAACQDDPTLIRNMKLPVFMRGSLCLDHGCEDTAEARMPSLYNTKHICR